MIPLCRQYLIPSLSRRLADNLNRKCLAAAGQSRIVGSLVKQRISCCTLRCQGFLIRHIINVSNDCRPGCLLRFLS